MNTNRAPSRPRLSIDRVLDALREDRRTPGRRKRGSDSPESVLTPIEMKLAEVSALAGTACIAADRIGDADLDGNQNAAAVSALRTSSRELETRCLEWVSGRAEKGLILRLVGEIRKESLAVLATNLDGHPSAGSGSKLASGLEFLAMNQAEMIGYLSTIASMAENDPDLEGMVEVSLPRLRTHLHDIVEAAVERA